MKNFTLITAFIIFTSNANASPPEEVNTSTVKETERTEFLQMRCTDDRQLPSKQISVSR